MKNKKNHKLKTLATPAESRFGGKNSRKKGFSIMEVMISMFVLTVGLLSALALISGSIKRSMDIRDRVIAAGLAQEGAELVRNVRDNNWASSNPQGTFDHFTMVPKDNCVIDITGISSFGCANGQPWRYRLKYNNSKLYVHNSGTDTKFRRRLKFEYYKDDGALANNLNTTTRVSIESIVTWGYEDTDDLLPANCDFSTRCVSVKDTLTKWK